MAVGPKDNIDRLLVRKYQSEKVDNSEGIVKVDATKMLDTMKDYADMHKNMLGLNQRLKSACSGINIKTAYYRPSYRGT